jgi:hypothetical protein
MQFVPAIRHTLLIAWTIPTFMDDFQNYIDESQKETPNWLFDYNTPRGTDIHDPSETKCSGFTTGKNLA